MGTAKKELAQKASAPASNKTYESIDRYRKKLNLASKREEEEKHNSHHLIFPVQTLPTLIIESFQLLLANKRPPGCHCSEAFIAVIPRHCLPPNEPIDGRLVNCGTFIVPAPSMSFSKKTDIIIQRRQCRQRWWVRPLWAAAAVAACSRRTSGRRACVWQTWQ